MERRLCSSHFSSTGYRNEWTFSCESTGPKEVAIGQGSRQRPPHLQGRRRAVDDVDLVMPSREWAESLQVSRYRWVVTGGSLQVDRYR